MAATSLVKIFGKHGGLWSPSFRRAGDEKRERLLRSRPAQKLPSFNAVEVLDRRQYTN
jgi:hypothetical protein